MTSPNAKFFCESCGAEVPRNAKFCKACGRFFSSVRCPNCGATGSPDKFADGCPECGYTVESGGAGARAKEKKATASRSSRKGLKRAIREKSAVFGGSTSRTDDALPFWIYVLTGVALLALLFCIMRYFGR